MQPRREGKERRSGLGVYSYVIAFAVIIAIAVSVMLLSNAATGPQTCASKLIPQSKYSCYSYYAVALDNASMCSELSSTGTAYVDQCLYDVATNHSNAPICTGISSNSIKYSCISEVGLSSRNSSQCMLLTGQQKDTCIYSVAKAEGFNNLSDCSSIGNATESLMCSSSYYYDMALLHGNLSYCDRLPHDPSSSSLDAIMPPSQTGSAVYSYYNITPRGYCYSKVAYLTGNESACSSLSGTDVSICEEAFINYTMPDLSGLESYCNNATSAGVRDMCLESIAVYRAVSTGNVTQCLGINQSDVRYTCVLDIAYKYNDSSYCSYLNDSTAQSNCRLSMQSG